MTEELVFASAWGSVGIIMSFLAQSTVKMKGKRPALRFGENKGQYISFFSAAVIVFIELIICGALEKLVIEPQITALYVQNIYRIWEILFAVGVGVFLNIWRKIGIKKEHRIWFILACLGSFGLLLNGLRVF
jgi:hypothetical protein